MENIINFLEQYWGVSVLGITTIGTIVTFIVTQFKAWAKDKIKNQRITDLIDTLDVTTKQLEMSEQSKRETENQLIINEQERSEVQAVTFKVLSYLVMASKMSATDKNALKEDMMNIGKSTKDTAVQLGTEVVDNVVEDVVEKTEKLISDVKNSAETLLNKYTESK